MSVSPKALLIPKFVLPKGQTEWKPRGWIPTAVGLFFFFFCFQSSLKRRKGKTKQQNKEKQGRKGGAWNTWPKNLAGSWDDQEDPRGAGTKTSLPRPHEPPPPNWNCSADQAVEELMQMSSAGSPSRHSLFISFSLQICACVAGGNKNSRLSLLFGVEKERDTGDGFQATLLPLHGKCYKTVRVPWSCKVSPSCSCLILNVYLSLQ